jgi:hypothetical protein
VVRSTFSPARAWRPAVVARLARTLGGATHPLLMLSVHVSSLPADALLQSYVASGAYTDCYAVTFPGQVSLAEFMAAFYTTRIFRLERWLLARLLRFPSTDQQAQLLGQGELTRFAAWHVESRESNQVIMAAGRTRSWLMASPSPEGTAATSLYFGSAVVQRRRGGLGWQFNALLGFHKLYSRALLSSASRRLVTVKRGPHPPSAA